MKKNITVSKQLETKNEITHRSDDFTSPDKDADKTSEDDNADKTIKKNKRSRSKLEINPDSTGIDTKADKTKPNSTSSATR